MTVAGTHEMAVGTTPGAAATGKMRIYPSSVDGLWHQVDESNVDTVLQGVPGAGYAATSATSFTPGTGSKAFTTQADLAYTAGARVRASSAAGPTTTYMEGVVTSYTGTTLTVTVDLFAGTGAHTDWDINLAGDQGVPGAGVPADVTAHGNLGSTETFDYDSGAQPEHSGTLNANCTFTFSNPAASGKRTLMTLQLAVDGSGPWAVTLPASVVNKTDAEAFLSAAAANSTVIVPFTTIDAGTSWYAILETLDGVLANSAGQDIADALTGAASPAAGNVFATMADVVGGVTVADEGSPLSTTATTLDFTGAGVTASGTGATKTINIPGGGGGVSVALLQDQKAQNTAGGTFTSGAWRTRDLNTEVSDADNIVTISSNQFTPISGTYLLKAFSPGRAVDRNQARLQNVTAASTVQLGTSSYSPASGTGDANGSWIDAVFTANGTDAYEIQHECQTTASTNGFGVAANLATEVYTSVVLMKIA